MAFHYVLETGDAAFDAPLCALLGQVQIGQGGPAVFHMHGVAQAVPPQSIIGPTDRWSRMQAPAGFIGVGSGFTPAGWNRLGGDETLANHVVPAGQLFGAALDGVTADGRSDAWLDALDRVLGERLAASPPADPRITAIDAWVVAGDRWDVDALAATLTLSRRSLERLTASTHGSTPKRLAAKYRSLQAAGRIAVGEVTDWRDAAALGGFADQAHFIREFKRFVGMTPQAFRMQPDCFQAQLLRGSWAPGQNLSISIWA